MANINLNCAVCNRLQDINWAMGGFILLSNSGRPDLITQVICQPCGPTPEAKQLMADNRKQNLENEHAGEHCSTYRRNSAGDYCNHMYRNKTIDASPPTPHYY